MTDFSVYGKDLSTGQFRQIESTDSITDESGNSIFDLSITGQAVTDDTETADTLFEGTLADINTAGASTSVGLFSQGRSTIWNTDTLSNSDAGWYATYTSQFSTRPIQFWKFGLSDTTAVRAFIGWTSGTFTTIAADDPSLTMFGLQYSTNRSDTNWQFVSDDGTTQTLVDTGVAISTDYLVLVLQSNSSTSTDVNIELRDEDNAVLASHTFSSNLPAVSVSTRPFFGVRTLTTAARGARIFGSKIKYRGFDGST